MEKKIFEVVADGQKMGFLPKGQHKKISLLEGLSGIDLKEVTVEVGEKQPEVATADKSQQEAFSEDNFIKKPRDSYLALVL